MCAFGSYYYPHESLIILRNTIINKSTKEVFVFCSGCYGQAQYLSWVVHQTILRAFSRYLFPMKDTKVLSIFHVSSNIYKLWLLLCYLRVDFHQLASPPGFHVAHIPMGNLVYMSYLVYFEGVMYLRILCHLGGYVPGKQNTEGGVVPPTCCELRHQVTTAAVFFA